MIINRNKQEMQEELYQAQAHLTRVQQALTSLPEEFDYPLYFELVSTGEIVKFKGLNTGEVVITNSTYPMAKVGDIRTDFIKHTDRGHWTPVAFNKERGLYDKQLVWCSDEGSRGLSYLKFYNAINNQAFKHSGERAGTSWDIITPAYVDEPWVQIAYDKLED